MKYKYTARSRLVNIYLSIDPSKYLYILEKRICARACVHLSFLTFDPTSPPSSDQNDKLFE